MMQGKMQKISPIKQRILQFADYLGISKRQFYEKIGVSRGTLESNTGITEDIMAKFIAIYPEISPEWLLTGKGEMLRASVAEEQTSAKAIQANNNKGIPLVSMSAAAGFGGANFAIKEADVKQYYIVPKFQYCNVDFMIEISGSSMYPKYNSGDVVACTILRERKFIQWNKCHIIATREQGLLCKRLCPSDKDEYIKAVSDNPSYPPFEIPKSEITGIALIIGVIRLE